MTSLTSSDVEIANRGADEFLRVFYATYDSAQRAEGVTKFYRDTSCLTYNGTAVTGPTAIRDLLERLPVTKHEVQSYDCHPIPTTSPPALLITVSGLVTHGQPSAGGGETKTAPPSRNVDNQPRVFSQTFILMKMEKYYISADNFRFVG
ncbi:NTF2-like protein [Gautieria morchelliformis]|nr:NTF2-like protein [Gautieria morchelliformis]